MIKKTISAACAVLLALASASCQKSNVEQYLGIRDEIADVMNQIHDEKSADKHADELHEILEKRTLLDKSMTAQEKAEVQAYCAEHFEEILKCGIRMEPDKQRIQNNHYYNSQKLRRIMGSPDFHL